MVGRHYTKIHRALKRRGYKLVAIRTALARRTTPFTLPDVERYLAERRAEGLGS